MQCLERGIALRRRLLQWWWGDICHGEADYDDGFSDNADDVNVNDVDINDSDAVNDEDDVNKNDDDNDNDFMALVKKTTLIAPFFLFSRVAS